MRIVRIGLDTMWPLPGSPADATTVSPSFSATWVPAPTGTSSEESGLEAGPTGAHLWGRVSTVAGSRDQEASGHQTTHLNLFENSG